VRVDATALHARQSCDPRFVRAYLFDICERWTQVVVDRCFSEPISRALDCCGILITEFTRFD
jgi:hypothetical protein